MNTHPDYGQLNDYADAVLDDVAQRDIDAHLAVCIECRTSLESIRDLQLWAQTLPREEPAPAEVWAHVRAATIESKTSQMRRALRELRYPLAAAAIVLLLLTSSVTWYFARQLPTSLVQQPGAENAQLAAYRDVEAEYARAAKELTVLLEQRRATLDTAVIRSVEENLRVMDEAIKNARAALRSDPSNQNVAGILAATQESKLRMLRRAVSEQSGT